MKTIKYKEANAASKSVPSDIQGPVQLLQQTEENTYFYITRKQQTVCELYTVCIVLRELERL
jgi:chaperonin cofactor prefoldin